MYYLVAFSTLRMCKYYYHFLIPEHFHYPPQSPVAIKQSLHISLSASSPVIVICFLSLQICQLQIFHVDGIMQCLGFCDWLIHLTCSQSSFMLQYLSLLYAFFFFNPTAAVPFNIPISSVLGFQFLHIFINSCYFPFS